VDDDKTLHNLKTQLLSSTPVHRQYITYPPKYEDIFLQFIT